MVNSPSISARMVSVELGGALVHVPYTGKLLDQACNCAAVNRGASRLHSSTVSQPHGGSGPFFHTQDAMRWPATHVPSAAASDGACDRGTALVIEKVVSDKATKPANCE